MPATLGDSLHTGLSHGSTRPHASTYRCRIMPCTTATCRILNHAPRHTHASLMAAVRTATARMAATCMAPAACMAYIHGSSVHGSSVHDSSVHDSSAHGSSVHAYGSSVHASSVHASEHPAAPAMGIAHLRMMIMTSAGMAWGLKR